MKRSALVAMLACSLAACGSGAPDDAQKTADMLSGDAAGSATDNPLCKLFQPYELEGYVGDTLGSGRNAAMGAGCQWTTPGNSGASVMIVVIDKKDNVLPSLDPGFQDRPDIGEKGFTSKIVGEQMAGVVVGNDAIRITAGGPKASADMTVALLQETVKRRAASGG